MYASEQACIICKVESIVLTFPHSYTQMDIHPTQVLTGGTYFLSLSAIALDFACYWVAQIPLDYSSLTLQTSLSLSRESSLHNLLQNALSSLNPKLQVRRTTTSSINRKISLIQLIRERYRNSLCGAYQNVFSVCFVPPIPASFVLLFARVVRNRISRESQ